MTDPKEFVDAEAIEGVSAAVGVFALGVAVGLTAMGLHGTVPTCQTVGGQVFGEFCAKWAWGQRMAWRSVQGALLAFAVSFTAARWETIAEELWGGTP